MAGERFTIKRLFKLYALYARIDFQWYLRDTAFFLIAITGDVIGQVSRITGVLLLSARFGGAGGMSVDEVLLMLGFATLVSGISELFFGGNNVGYVSRRIGRGQIDHMLLQPVPLRAQLLAEGFMPLSGSSVILGGAALTAYAVSRLGLDVTPRLIALLVGLPLCSLAVMLAISYLAGCVAFYSPVQGEEASSLALNALMDLGHYPLGAIPEAARIVLTTAIPVGLFSWYPVCVILGRPPLPVGALLPLALALLMCSLAGWLFRRGLRYYIKHGCRRYGRMGFRN